MLNTRTDWPRGSFLGQMKKAAVLGVEQGRRAPNIQFALLTKLEELGCETDGERITAPCPVTFPSEAGSSVRFRSVMSSLPRPAKTTGRFQEGRSVSVLCVLRKAALLLCCPWSDEYLLAVGRLFEKPGTLLPVTCSL